MDELERLRREAARDDVQSRALERALGREYAQTAGVPVNSRGYANTEHGAAQCAADFARGRREWLESRWNAQQRNQRWAAEATRAQAGVSRFLQPGMTLDRLARITEATPAAVDELARDRRDRVARERAELLEARVAARTDAA